MWTEFTPASAQTVNQWSAQAFYQWINKTFMRNLMGEDENAVVQVKRDLAEGRGDKIKYDLLLDLEGDGVDGDDILEDNTEGLDYQQDSVNIDQKRHAVEARTMSQQRTVHNLRRDGMRKLTDWWSKRFDIWGHAHLAGTAGSGNANATRAAAFDGFAGNSYTAPDAAHLIDKSGVGPMLVTYIDACVETAQTLEPLIRPVMIGGQPYYILLCHPYSWTELRSGSAAAGSWVDLQKSAGVRGMDNPIFSGASGIYNNTIIYVSNYVPYDTATNVAHNIFMGCQSLVMAFGNAYDELDQETYGKEQLFAWLEQRRDFGNRKMIGGGMVFGLKKPRFNGADFGTIVLRTNDSPHS